MTSMEKTEVEVFAWRDRKRYLWLMGLIAARGSESEAVDAAVELLRRTVWHLRRAGFEAGRQQNPSGAVSGDKLTVFADGGWHAVDIFYDYGAPGVPIKVIFKEVFPASPVGDEGIPD